MIFSINSEERKTKTIIKDNIESIVGIFALKPIADSDDKASKIKIKGQCYEKIGNSSGFFVSEKGLVATNYHPISDRKLVYKIFWNEIFYDGVLFYYDDINDLAILKIQTNDKRKFNFVKMGDSSSIALGQTVISIGNVLDEFQKTVSKGIISGLSRYVKTSSNYRGTLEYKGLIQTDAAINPGNSGGPLFNLKGEVVGITTLAVSGVENIGLAIPINPVKKVVRDLKSFGQVKSVSLGVRYIIIDSQAQKSYDLPSSYGAFIIYDANQAGIIKGSLAEKNGIKEGDIILEVNGEKINHQNTVQECLKNVCLGDTIKLKILRGQKEVAIKMVLS